MNMHASEQQNAAQPQKCPLNRREVLAIQLSADGLSAKRAAHEMGITENTLNHYLYAARGKLRVANMASLVAEAFRNGWVQ